MTMYNSIFSRNCVLSEQIARQVFNVLPDQGPMIVIMDRDGHVWPSDSERFSKLNPDEAVLKDLCDKIDELEKAMSGGTGESRDGGVGRRLFGAFLTWLQEKKHPVFVVATANDLFNMPPELLRKGRFDEIFFVDLPTDAERRAIFRIHLKLRKQSPDDFDIDRLCAAADGFSGAEIEQAVIASLYRALYQKQPLDTELILEELEETVPLSVSRHEDITRLRETARGRFVNVN